MGNLTTGIKKFLQNKNTVTVLGVVVAIIVLYVAYNMHWKEKEFALPKLPGKKKWHIAATTQKGVLSKINKKEYKKIIKIKPRTIVVLVGKENDET